MDSAALDAIQPGLLAAPFSERYVIERELGRGASSIVYLARDLTLGQPVAIKALRPELAQSIQSERFLREVRLTTAFQHPNIATVLDSGVTGGVLFCVMPYMTGGNLRQLLARETQLPLEQAVSIGSKLAKALQYAHSNNVVHRDVKPDNILFAEGEVYLADFGIARAIERAGGDLTTSTDIIRGTPAYMSPEQAAGQTNYDGRSDIFSLGCVLYEAVAGVRAFIGPTLQSELAQRFTHPPRPLDVYRPATPRALSAVIQRSLAITPADRYQTAGEFADALERSLTVRDSRFDGWSRRSTVVVGSIILLAAVAAGAWSFRARAGVASPANALAARQEFIQGNRDARAARSPAATRSAIRHYSKATELDPTFAPAFARLATMHSNLYRDVDRTDTRRDSAAAALQRALALDPAAPDTRLALGVYTYRVRQLPDSADVFLEAALTMAPDSAELLSAVGTIFRAQGRWRQALALSRRASVLEPSSAKYAFDIASTELWAGDFGAADRDLGKVMELDPGFLPAYISRSMLQVVWKGSVKDAQRILGIATRQPRMDTAAVLAGVIPTFRPMLALLDAPWQSALEKLPLSGVDTSQYYLALGDQLRRRRDPRANSAFAKARDGLVPRVAANPSDAFLQAALAYAYAGTGAATDARAHMDSALAQVPKSEDIVEHAFVQLEELRMDLLLEDYDAAFRLLEEGDLKLIITKALLNVHPDFDPLRKTPRFQSVLRRYP